ncbi:dna glycosylase [Pyrenophora seminiperda CCB06]|uniref:Dna glycosylase n=1 Tax=Pyrenophora seminiperda CCB06 TaxID=1302712 RepID=A0A3M7M8M1_9PLEO|nr:dna glycosylase [Pyrenophora seminiperda CCB06]
MMSDMNVCTRETAAPELLASMQAADGGWDSCSTCSDSEDGYSESEHEHDQDYDGEHDQEHEYEHANIANYYIKAKRVHLSLMLLLIFVFATLFITDVQLSLTSQYVKHQYHTASTTLRTYTAAQGEQAILYYQLDTLLSQPLDRGFFLESHEECLVRALHEADKNLFGSGYGFQFANVRGQVVEWATESCGKQQFAVQKLAKNDVFASTTLRERLQQRFADLRYRSMQMVGGLFRHLKQEVARRRQLVTSKRVVAKLLFNDFTTAGGSHRNETTPPVRLLPTVPFGFALTCDRDQPGLHQPCRLTDPPTSSTTTSANETAISASHHMASLQHHMQQLAHRNAIIRKARLGIHMVVPIITSLVVFLVDISSTITNFSEETNASEDVFTPFSPLTTTNFSEEEEKEDHHNPSISSTTTNFSEKTKPSSSDPFTESETSSSDAEYMIGSDTVDLGGGLTADSYVVPEVECGWCML